MGEAFRDRMFAALSLPGVQPGGLSPGIACREPRPETMSETAVLPFPLLPSLAGSAIQPVTSVIPAMATLPDRALLERVAGGDTDAFTVLYRRFERPVFAMLLRLAGGRRAVAEDLLQEAFVRVWLGAATH